MLTTLAIENYRSLRHLVAPLDGLTVITGANGTGKSSVYRSLRLLAEASRNGAVASLAREGGIQGTLWAGPPVISNSVRSGRYPVQGTAHNANAALRLGFAGDDFGYAIDFGFAGPGGNPAFSLDPEIKAESVWSGALLRPSTLLTERRGPAVRIRGESGEWRHHDHRLRPYDSMLSEFADPRLVPELLTLRDQIRSWRFYDHFRSDAAAPARAAQIGTRTPVLAHDGSDLAAAILTAQDLGPAGELDAAVDRAFPGSRVEIVDRDGWFEIAMRQPGMLRPLAASELSDGTLRYLLWIAALLSPRPSALLVLNEPETSLHPELITPLAELVLAASARSQVVIVTHSAALISALAEQGSPSLIELRKDFGETVIDGQGMLDEPAWNWPKR